jgi:hypothetical protein
MFWRVTTSRAQLLLLLLFLLLLLLLRIIIIIIIIIICIIMLQRVTGARPILRISKMEKINPTTLKPETPNP